MTSRNATLRDTAIVLSIVLITVALHQVTVALREAVQTLKAVNAEVIRVAEDARSAHHVPPPTPAHAVPESTDPR